MEAGKDAVSITGADGVERTQAFARPDRAARLDGPACLDAPTRVAVHAACGLSTSGHPRGGMNALTCDQAAGCEPARCAIHGATHPQVATDRGLSFQKQLTATPNIS